jgi:hypothetical protein
MTTSDPTPPASLARAATLKTIVATGLVTAVATAFVSDLVTGAKDVALSLIGAPPLRPAAFATLDVSARPVFRQHNWHPFHTCYSKRYSVLIENQNAIIPQRVTLEINSTDASVAGFAAPPFSRARLANGEDAGRWEGEGHGDDPTLLFVEVDLPPPRAQYTCIVTVTSVKGFPKDSSFYVQLSYPGGLVKSQAEQWAWVSIQR